MKTLKAFRIDTEILSVLESIAEEEQRSLSNLVNKILSDFVNKK